MRAIGIMEFGGPEVLQVVELPDPVAGPGELAIRVRAATVNPTDTVLRSGGRADRLKDVPPPYVPGMDAAGILEQIGDGVDTDLALGDRVMAIVVPLGAHGAYAERVVVPAESVVRSPVDSDRCGSVHAADERVDGAPGPRRVVARTGEHVGRDGCRGLAGRVRRAVGQGRWLAGRRRRGPCRRAVGRGVRCRHDGAAGRPVLRGGSPGAARRGRRAGRRRPVERQGGRRGARRRRGGHAARLRRCRPCRVRSAEHPVPSRFTSATTPASTPSSTSCAPRPRRACSPSVWRGRSRQTRRPKRTACSRRAACAAGSCWSSEPRHRPARAHHPRRSTSQRSTTSSPSTMCRCS